MRANDPAAPGRGHPRRAARRARAGRAAATTGGRRGNGGRTDAPVSIIVPFAFGSWLAVSVHERLGASTLAARAMGVGWRDAGTLGVLLNTRGLVELVVLNIGLDLGILTPVVFSMLVVMALVTTFATSPIVRGLTPEPRPGAVRSQVPAYNETNPR